MNASSVAGAVTIAVGVGLDAAGNAEPAMHVDPLVLEAGEPALDLLEIGEIVDLAEIRELLLRAHAQRVDLVDRAAQHAVLVDHAVPYQVTLVSSTDTGSNTWMWLPSSEKFGNTLMLTGSEEARSRMSSALAP